MNHQQVLRHKRKIIWLQSNKKCFYCGEELEFKKSTLDHVIPRSKGGNSYIKNLVLACKKCNVFKSISDQPNYLKFPDWWPQSYVETP